MSNSSLNQFLRACNLGEPPRLLVRANGPDESSVQRLRFPGPFAILGTHPTADITINEPGLRPRHYYLQAIGSKVLSVDLASESPAKLFEVKDLVDWLELRRGQNHSRHLSTLAFEGRPARLGTLPEPDADYDDSAGVGGSGWPLLEFRTKNLVGRWRMKRRIALLGNAPGCSARLACPTLSRFHCSFILTRRGLWVVDLLGEIDSPTHEGTLLNGDRVRFARFDVGDVLEIGRFRVQVRAGEASARRRGAGDPALVSLRSAIEDRIASEESRHRSRLEYLRNELEAVIEESERVMPSAPGPQWEPAQARETSPRMLGSVLRVQALAPLPDPSTSRETRDEPSRIEPARRLGFVCTTEEAQTSWIPSIEA